nr:Trp biosynthesis-associated membrane protein [Micromonospora sp. HNM0581]
MAYAVLLCLAGAGLALWAVTRTWVVDVADRAELLPLVEEGRTGGQLLAWLPALSLVGLAGGGAVLATRGRVRRVLGGLLVILGLTLAAGGGYGLLGNLGDLVTWAWPALVLLGGILTAAGGALTLLRGHRWPAMGTRYERRPAQSAGGGGPIVGAGTVEAWEALDRGEDPTAH